MLLKMKNKNKKMTAFTLVELLVVIVIMGILSGIGISQFNSYIEKARIAKAISFSKQLDIQLMAQTISSIKTPLGIWNFDSLQGTRTPDSTVNGNDILLGSTALLSSDTYNGINTSLSNANGESNALLNDHPTDEITISFWIKSNDENGCLHCLFTSNGWNISYNNEVAFKLDYGTNWNDSSRYVSTVNDPADGKWHHIMGTYDGDIMALYIDGVKKDEKSVGVIPVDINRNLRLGYHSSDFLIDDLRIYPVSYRDEN